jgi:DNA-binding CsgD family transcriptional regulator
LGATAPTVDVVGRDTELATLHAFVAASDGAVALVLEGEPGIGKTTLWLAAVEEARRSGAPVLATRPAEAESTLAHVALGDLFDSVLDDVLRELTPPRRRSLEVALLRADDDEADPVDPRALGLAVRDVLERLGTAGALLVAIDDVQWLDAASSSVLAFAMRRLPPGTIRVLLARRLGTRASRNDVERAFAPQDLRRMAVGPLSAGATHRMVRDRLGVALPRQTMLRVHEHSGGNPFFALEIARVVQDADPLAPLPVPPTLEEVLRERLAALPAATRDALSFAAAFGPCAEEQLAQVGIERGVIDAAVAANVVVRDAGTIRFSHPLLAAVLYGDLGPRRREVHRRIAQLLDDRIARARHVALATSARDTAVAAELDGAARVATARGAPAAAAELAEHAARLTPQAARDDQLRRLLAAARAHRLAGEWTRARALATRIVDAPSSGAVRAEALMLLSELEGIERAAALLEEALVHAGARPDLQFAIECRLAWATRFIGDARHTRAALALADQIGDETLRIRARAVEAVLAWFAGDVDAAAVLTSLTPHLTDALGAPRLVQEATQAIVNTLAPADTRGRAYSLLDADYREWCERDEPRAACALWGLAWLEFWAGRWPVAADHAARAYDIAVQYGLEVPQDHLPLAVIQVHRGLLDEARAHSRCALALAEEQFRFHPPQHLAVMALAAVGEGDVSAGAGWFDRAQRRAVELGWREPSVRWWTGDHAELLLELGRIDEALALVDAWASDARGAGRIWVLPHAKRCRALAAAARGEVATALDALEAALREHGAVGDPFGSARALLALGVIRRRARQKRPAREAIEAARDAFAGIGAAGWAARADRELGRVSGRTRSSDLTAAERRVAALVAAGHTNREVAAALFLGERTVASHLNHIYAKLGVRTRTELALRMRDDAHD